MEPRTGITACLAAFVLLARGAPADAQCLPPNDTAEGLLLYSQALATESGQPWQDTRATHDIPETSVDEVELVTESAICVEAGERYRNMFGLQGPAPDVHVVRIGTRYLVTNPDTKRGEFTMYAVLDLSFNEVSSFGG